MRIALILRDEARLGQVAGWLRARDFDVALEETDAPAALPTLASGVYDALVMDLAMPGLDALGVMRRLKSAPGTKALPATVLIAPAPMPAFERLALDEGACSVVSGPLNADTLSGAICATAKLGRLSPVSDDDVMDILCRMGFARRMLGTRYLARCICLTLSDERLCRRLTTQLYPMVAGSLGTEPDRVAHAMRRAIERAWSEGAIQVHHQVFGNTIDARRGKPTAGEMIARIAQQIRTKEAGINL